MEFAWVRVPPVVEGMGIEGAVPVGVEGPRVLYINVSVRALRVVPNSRVAGVVLTKTGFARSCRVSYHSWNSGRSGICSRELQEKLREPPVQHQAHVFLGGGGQLLEVGEEYDFNSVLKGAIRSRLSTPAPLCWSAVLIRCTAPIIVCRVGVERRIRSIVEHQHSWNSSRIFGDCS